jgi:hypothetical protein
MAREVEEGSMLIALRYILDAKTGKQEMAQCNVFGPSRLVDIEGINSEGREARLSIILGRTAAGFETDNSDATNIVRMGGYKRGAGSKEAGMVVRGHLAEDFPAAR